MSELSVLTVAVDVDNLPQRILDYEKKYGKKPAGLVVDSWTAWDLLGKLHSGHGPLAEELMIKGVQAFDETPLMGLRVIFKISKDGKRFADLIGKVRLDKEVKAMEEAGRIGR